MDPSSQFLLTIGGILLLGLLVSVLASRTFLPRVTLLLLLGLLIGEQGFNIIPNVFADRFDIIADMTLLMVGFLLGGKLTRDALKESAGQVLWIAISAALLTALFVAVVLMAIGISTEVAILLGCIASATAPAAILDVISESRRQSRFSNLLLSIVAFDDVVALVLFGVGVAVVKTLNGLESDTFFLFHVLGDIGGATLLGLLIGLPAAYLTGRIKEGQPMLTEALGIVFLCGGLAIWFNVSYLIATMVMGAVIANLAKHHDYPFHAIEGIESLFMVVFFVLAGASLELASIREIGLIGVVFILCRCAGKYLGAWLGGSISHTATLTRRWMGIALLPQAGVPIGMALVASSQFPEHGQIILSVVISTTVFFDLIGPVFTRLAIERAGEG